MNRTLPLHARAQGFSLLEVLIAVVLLATGLLALAALQGSLARNSADAKVRSRVIALMQAELDTQRATAYGNVVSAPAVAAVSPDCTSVTLNAVESAACDAGLSNLTMTRTVESFGGAANGSAFAVGAPVAPNKAQFKRVTVTANWTDAGGQTRTSTMSTAISSLALDVNSPLVSNNSGNAPPPSPVVRQADPTTAGMIPIAMGNGDSTAASNPTPEKVGGNNNQAILGTRFTVLTYTPQSNNLAEIQARVETEVVKCTCQYGAGGNNLGAIYRKSQWPAVWTGTRYDVYAPDTPTNAPGQQYAAGPKAGVTQSPLCQECCRDHHDNPADTTNAKFDPESTATTYQKYYLNNSLVLQAAPNTNNSTYVDACRIIRVDGLWRTAADMYSRQFGVLETTTVASKQARLGAPSSSATANYTAFVKDYLKQYDGSTGSAPTNAQAFFDDPPRNLNPPPTVSIASALQSNDERYVHGRGLYVDYLEKQARDTLAKALAKRRAAGECAANSSGLADCILPYLPFTTINLTEIADWAASDPTVLEVNTQRALGTNPDYPSGGRITKALKNGASDDIATMRTSNSGVAALANTGTPIPGAVDPGGDAAIVSDAQPFVVGGTAPPSGSSFTFRLQVVDAAGNYPASLTQVPVFSFTSGSASGTCSQVGANPYLSCTVANTSGSSVTLAMANYGKAGADTITASTTCTSGSTKTEVVTYSRPYWEDWSVNFVSLGSTSYSPSVTRSTYDDETSVVTLGAVNDNDLVKVNFVYQSKTNATISSCKITGNNANASISNIVWNYPYR